MLSTMRELGALWLAIRDRNRNRGSGPRNKQAKSAFGRFLRTRTKANSFVILLQDMDDINTFLLEKVAPKSKKCIMKT